MPSKLQIYAQMADYAATQITGSWKEWTAFLTTAARLYKYPYNEQLMIFAQRPDATACAEYDLWNDKMFRYVRRGSKGIALIDDAGDRPRLRYVFDISDTGGKENARRPFLWELRREHEEIVTVALERKFEVSAPNGLANQLERIATQLADEYWNEHQQDILHIVDGSYLEEYDDFNIGVQFKNAAAVSITYALLSRCGLEPENYFEHEDFMAIFDFNTPAAVAALGTAVSQSNQEVLRQIGITIQNYEREKLAERSITHGEQLNIQPERRLSDSRSADERSAREATGQVWQNEKNLSERTQTHSLQSDASRGETVSAPVRDRRDSEPASGTDDARIDERSGSDRNSESQRSDEMGRTDEQLQSAGGGEYSEGTYQQLTLNLFPSEQEQIKYIEEESSVKTSGSFSVSQAEIDDELRRGSGFQNGKLRIYALYQHGVDKKEAITFLKEEYGLYGHTTEFLDGAHGIADYSGKGLKLERFDLDDKIIVKWPEIEKRLRQLVRDGNYLTDGEKKQYEQLERDFAGVEGGVPMPQAKCGFPKPEKEVAVKESEVSYLTQNTMQRELTQADIDAALQEWNGDINSKHAVVRYMEQHGREKDTASWLRAEYGDDLPAFPVTAEGAAADIPWAKVQRRIAQLIRTEQFYKQEEEYAPRFSVTMTSDAFPDPEDAFSIWDAELGNYYTDTDDRIVTFPNEQEAESYLEKLETRVDAREGAEQEELQREVVAEFLASDLEQVSPDLREVLTGDGGLFTQRDKEIISAQFRNGLGNTRIAQQLSERFAGTAETMKLTTGETADYFGSTISFEVNLHDKFDTKLTHSWSEIVPVLRALYQQEQDGFSHEPVDHEVVNLEGKPSYKVGDSVVLDFGNRIASGTIGYIGEQEVRVDTGPYAWSNENISREHFEKILRQNAQNTHLFIPENQVSAAENYHITDDTLGTGGAKAKFRMNMDAIYLLKQLEADSRNATYDEQVVLSKYVGWGGLSDVFDESKPSWTEEFKELKAAMSPEEYAAARGSTLNAHYTSPTVIKAIYEAVGKMGFRSGNILEPSCGVGNFFGLLPEEMSASRLYGVELDSITGRIAKQLYPKADITVAGFESTNQRDFYDIAIGNVPFGQYKVNDPAYNKLGFNIHNYFFAKTLDQVRPGGVVAFVTSRYTMDAKDSTVRRYLAQRAELLGAIRLPNNAFKANAGTEVVSDIIFLQKRDRPIELAPGWTQTAPNEDGFSINSYFLEHPEMVLGRTTQENTAHGMDYTVEPIEGLLLSEQLHDAVKYIRGTYQEAELPELGEGEDVDTSLPADPNVKNYSYTVVDGEVYYRENSRMVRPDLNTTAESRVRGMVELRECVNELIDLQMEAYASDAVIKEKQAELNQLYDIFSEKYGLINDRANRLAFSDDSSYYLLCALEVLDEEGQLERKADMFTKRTIKPHQAVTSVDTASEALAVSIAEKARIDMEYMAELTGKNPEEIAAELRGVIFKDPAYTGEPLAGWQTADEYLSGNVRQKLRQAQRAADKDEAFEINVEALKAAQPKELDASEIEVRLGATWIDKSYIQQFMYETFDTPRYLRGNIEVKYAAYTAEWQISSKNSIPYNNIAAYTTYGTDRANAYKILEDSLNLRDVRIYDTVEDADGKERRVLNAKETTLAAQKQQAIRDAFKDWIWKDPERRQTLVAQYNEEMNSTRPREYDGSHITFGGMNPEIALREHQKNAIAHVLYGGNTLLAHEVGAGKTFEMVAAAMESKRLGLCQKSIFVVPNHLTEQWASEFLRLYPSANILVTTKKDFETHNRKKFCARIATGDYDAVIIGHSQFERIPISKERQEHLLRKQIEEITEGIYEVEASGGERFTVKQLERTRKNLETRLEKLQAEDRKDDVVTFEQLGVDRMFVDESHNYKNLFLYTKMRNVAGLSTTDAQKSSDMFAKCRYMDELTGNRGVVFATGTPVSNSMTELYTVQRYLQYDRLQELNMIHFDCWASRFGETTTALELAPEGTGYRARTRFSKFFNLPELMNLFKEIADIKTADQLNLPTPEVEYHNIVAQPTEHQQEMVKALSERAAEVHSGSVDPSVDNMLKITSDGRKLGLDQRIINALLPDESGTKVNQCVDNIMQIWKDGQDEKLTQLVFCDISTPQSAPSRKVAKGVSGNLDNPELHALETDNPLEEPERAFTVYEDIREKLIAKGIPSNQIAFIHDANTEVRKKELFAKVRTGQVRVLMGSTAKMGAGTNVQDRLVALHDLDCPWRPGDLAQRKGRIERQGNQNPLVHVYRYVTEGTFDAYLWQTVENKQKFISQIMSSKSPVRSCDDVDETALSFAEIKALCAGDPRIKERMDLDVEVSRLKLMKADHQSKQFRLEDNLLKYFPEQIEQNKGFLKGLETDMEILSRHPYPEEGFAGMEVRGDVLTDKENAGAALLDACKEVKTTDSVQIGSYRGFAMYVNFDAINKEYILQLRGEMTHRATLGADPRGNLVRIDNALGQMPDRLKNVQAQLDNLYQQQDAAKGEVGKPFPYEDELKIKTARLVELDSLLNMDGRKITQDQAIAKSAKPSVLDGLKRSMPQHISEKKTKSHEEVR